MGEESDLVVVFVSQGPLPAEVAKSKLESDGIAALLRYQAIGRVLGLTVDGLGRVEVLVASADETRARRLLAETETQADPDDDQFPQKGTNLEPDDADHTTQERS